MPLLTLFLTPVVTSELQELRDMVQQLQAEKVLANSPQSDVDSAPGSPVDSQHSVCNDPPPSERLLYIPREGKCPIFRGTADIFL